METLAKKEIRDILHERRNALSNEKRKTAASALVGHFKNYFDLREGAIISGYWPIRSEMDIRPLLTCLHEEGFELCLPVITQDLALVFKSWQPGKALIEGEFGVCIPAEDCKIVVPDTLLVPLLGYDKQGNRLGYGKGHYDKTLEKLRKTAKIAAIGVAFSCQEVDEVPAEPHDQKLDFILTEQGVAAF